MARIKMVTRTIERTLCDCMVVDLSQLEKGIFNLELDVQGKVDEVEAKKILDKTYAGAYSIIKINNVKPIEILMGMSEDDFIKYAKRLDVGTRKVIE